MWDRGTNICSKILELIRITNCIFYTFAVHISKHSKYFIDILGTTGFDSKDSRLVSISSYEITLVKPNFNFLNGEDNYALAA